jgi:carboxymethylenebutenolidase
MDQRIIDLYDAYTHGAFGRREFVDRLVQVAGGARRTRSGVLQNDYARAVIAEDDRGSPPKR